MSVRHDNEPPLTTTATLRVAPKVIGMRERFGYAAGDMGFNFLFDMGLNPAIAGSVFLVAKIWDAFADITVGGWVEVERTGVPFIRPLVLEFPEDRTAAGIDDQYLFARGRMV